MRLSFTAVSRWLEAEGPNCTHGQLAQLQASLDSARTAIARKDARLAEALVQAEAAARAAGVSLDELLQRTKPSVDKPRKADVRKPYLNPYDANSQLTALRPGKARPDWVEQLVSAGWDVSELHYKRHAAALRARGEEPRYDAVARYKLLAAQES
jgi:hypothetical protein